MIYYVVMKVQKWSDVKLEPTHGHGSPFPVEFNPPGNGEIGFLSVFDNMEAAIEYAGSASLVTIAKDLGS